MASMEYSWPIPMKAIGAQNLLTMPGGVTISGYLHKKGGTQLQLLKWPLRFVIIHKGCVYYFKSSTSASSQGAFSLNGYNRVMRATEETTSNNVFPFKIVHISKKHRTWYFSASSEDERKKWMSSLRKEIDYYHEKKETVTDLSDPDSDTDSFYGSVERPVAIQYNQSTGDSEESLQGYDDDDDGEEDYEKPDVDDLINSSIPPPNYPPPPPPEPIELQRKTHIPGAPSKPQPPLPLPKKTFSVVEPMNVRKEHFGYPQPHLKWPSTLPHNKSGEPPPVPPVSYLKKVAADKTTGNTSPSPIPVLPLSNACLPSPNELRKKLKSINMSPPGPPIPPTKPKALQTDHGNEPLIPREHNKPVLFKPEVLPKPQPVLKAANHVKKVTSGKPAVSPLQRSSPDGQSFREFSFEKPKPLPRSPKEHQQCDSDEDYEKVPLPSSIYVKTTDSFEVERMMKDNSTGRCPLNGLYCIRDSTKSGQVLVVWDASSGKVRNYRIFEKCYKVYIEECCMFPQLESLVEHYHTHILPSHDTLILQHPFGYNGPR